MGKKTEGKSELLKDRAGRVWGNKKRLDKNGPTTPDQKLGARGKEVREKKLGEEASIKSAKEGPKGILIPGEKKR